MKSINYLLVFFYCTIGFSQVSALDTSFGNDGIVALDGSSPGGIKVLNDGKILFLAYTNNHISLIRLMTDGSIDSSFNAQSPVFSGAPKSMFVQPDGKVIVLTATDTGTTSTNTLFRFNADGTIDTLFGVNGYVSNCFQSSTPALSYTSLPPNAKITSDPSTGNIFISITTKSPTQHTSIIASYTSNGVINTSFNSTGFKTWSSGYRREIKDLVIDSSGKIVAAGYTGHAISTTGSLITDNWVCRLNADGSMDTTFSGDGIVAIASGSSISSYSSNAVYFKDNGSMVVAGSKGGASASVYDKFTIYEITSNGDLVNASMPLAFNYSIYPTASVTVKKCYDLVRDNNGKYILGGGVQLCEGHTCDDFGLLRLNSDYSNDSSFGVNGWVTSFNENQHRSHYLSEMAVQPDNKILVLGGTQQYNSNTFNKIYIARYLNTTTLNTQDFEFNNQITIFPNPVAANLNIKVNNVEFLNTHFEIVDINGRIIFNGILADTDSNVNVEKLSNGIYFIKFEKENRIQKFIKQ